MVNRIINKLSYYLNNSIQVFQIKIHYIHIGKTGGSALKHALSKNKISRKYNIILHDHDTKLSQIPKGEKVIFFIRDPIDRYVSGFNSRKRKGKPLYNIDWTVEEKSAFENFISPNHLAESLNDPNTNVKNSAELAMRSIYHVRSSYWDWFISEDFLLSRKSDIFYIGRQETLKNDFNKLKQLLGISNKIRLPDDEVKMHKNPATMDRSLSNLAIHNLKNWYWREYQFLSLCNIEFGIKH